MKEEKLMKLVESEVDDLDLNLEGKLMLSQAISLRRIADALEHVQRALGGGGRSR